MIFLSFENDNDRESCKRYFRPTIEIKDYNVMIDGRKCFDQPIKNDLKTIDNIRKITTSQGDDYTTGCLLDYPYFKEHYKLIVTDLRKQQELDTDPRTIQQINYPGNLEQDGNAKLFSLLKKQKKLFRFFKRNRESIVILFCFNIK